MYKWNLATNTYTFWDRLRICWFFLNRKNRWTQDKYVREYEQLAANYVGAKYAVFLSSGSAANQLICQQIKDKLVKNGQWPQKNQVIVNSVTWQTNVSVWIREGFEPVFIDISLDDFCLDYNKLNEYLSFNSEKVACVFPTSVLGFTPNLHKLIRICHKHKVELKLDNCENSEGTFSYNGKNICGEITCSTSVFIAHMWNNGQEGGFIFTNNKEEYEYFLLSRAHGLRRNLLPYQEFLSDNVVNKYSNPLVDPQFDFQTLSSNYRNSDIAAFCGILDYPKWNKNRSKRLKLYKLFYNNLDQNKFFLPNQRENIQDIAFCLPIIIKNEDQSLMNRVKETLDSLKIERRSFISGNMLRQIPYQKYGDYKNYKNAEHLNNFAVYIGLHPSVTKKQILRLCEELNKL